MSLKTLVKEWCPPLLLNVMRRAMAGSPPPPRFEGDYSTWEEAAARAVGYDSDAIFARTRDAILKVVRGEAAFERDSVILDRPEYPLFLIASLLHVAAASGGRLDILDFGGSLGSSFFQCRPFVSPIRGLRWSVVEQPHYVAFGKAQLETEVLRFHRTIADCLSVERPNVAVLSGVLHCLPSPWPIVDEIIAADLPYVIVDRQPLSPLPTDRVSISRVPKEIYEGSYPLWWLSEPRFRASWAARYDVVAEAELAPLDTPVGLLPRRQMLLARRR
jgi:putative methyltransferase (TIGR04325 family)